MTGLTAIVLAASRGGADPVALAAGVPLKAFAPVGGAPMLDRVIATLQATPEIARILIVLPEEADLRLAPGAAEAVAQGRAARIAPAATPCLSVTAALDAAKIPFPALIVTADHALLQPAMVREFVASVPAGADVAFALAEEQAYRRLFPESRRTWLRFRDGAYSGCNLFLLATPRAREALAVWRRVETERKTPWRLARLLGVSAILAYLGGRLSLSDVTARAQRQFGLRIAPVILSDPTAAIDVDKAADMELAERVVAARATPSRAASEAAE